MAVVWESLRGLMPSSSILLPRLSPRKSTLTSKCLFFFPQAGTGLPDAEEVGLGLLLASRVTRLYPVQVH